MMSVRHILAWVLEAVAVTAECSALGGTNCGDLLLICSYYIRQQLQNGAG